MRLCLLLRVVVRIIVLVAVLAAPAAGQHWPQFRGPNGTAIADGAHLPNTWSREENVAWVATIDGTGWSSPIVWADRVYVTSAITEGEYLPPSPGIFGMELYNRLRDEGLSEAELVYVLHDNLERPFLAAFDKGSGAERWTVEREAGPAMVPSG